MLFGGARGGGKTDSLLGRAITRSAGVTLARMAPGQAAATGAGQFVEVVLIPN